MKYIVLAAIVSWVSSSPIHINTATSRPPPVINCYAHLCTDGEGKARADGNYRHPDGDHFFVTCEGGKPVSCQACDFDGFLVFNEFCNQCRYPVDKESRTCDFYTGSTVANTVCSADDNLYAQWFCQNLPSIYGASWVDQSGDFAYRGFDSNFQKKSSDDRANFYISCVGGMYGWCRFCPTGLVWYRLKDEKGNEELDSGICDYPSA